jgi:branched-chain amino acid transport system substrate-binding protein
MHRALVALVLALVASVGLAACGSSGKKDSGSSGGGGSSSAPSTKPITLGFAIGQTGFMTAYDGPPKLAAQLAIDDINKAGGVNGRKLRIVSADTKSKAELAGDAATQVLGDGADIVVTSCDFDLGSPAAIVAQNAGKLAFSTCAASAAFGPAGIGPLAYTMATAANAEGATMAEYASSAKHYKSAYVLVDNTLEFTKQSTYGFTHRWSQLGGTLGQDTFKQDDQSIEAQITRLKGLSKQPDFIYLASYMPGEAKAIKQIRDAGVNLPILADEDVDGDYWKGAVPHLSGVTYTTYTSIYGDDPDAKVNELVQRYTSQAGKKPDTGSFITGYAMVQAIAKAIAANGGTTDGKTLAKTLDTYKDEPFVLPTTFTPALHIALDRTERVMQVTGGKTTFVRTWKPTAIPIAAVKK